VRVWRPRWPNESQIIKHLIWQRVFQPEKYRPQTQREWARELGVTQQYVSKIESRLKEGMYRLVCQGTDATLDELRKARGVRLSRSDSPESETAERQSLPPEEGTSSDPQFETSPPQPYVAPAEMHAVAGWEGPKQLEPGPVGAPRLDLMEELRKELRRRPTTIRFRIPGCF
jgi:transcriptional regulator with XRE-family HTH domain